jgi:hypothetical protein
VDVAEEFTSAVGGHITVAHACDWVIVVVPDLEAGQLTVVVRAVGEVDGASPGSNKVILDLLVVLGGATRDDILKLSGDGLN